jgi:hypothetical protein
VEEQKNEYQQKQSPHLEAYLPVIQFSKIKDTQMTQDDKPNLGPTFPFFSAFRFTHSVSALVQWRHIKEHRRGRFLNRNAAALRLSPQSETRDRSTLVAIMVRVGGRGGAAVVVMDKAEVLRMVVSNRVVVACTLYVC